MTRRPISARLLRSLAVVAGAAFAPACAFANPGWSWQAPTPMPYTLRSAALLDNGHGFAVGDSGALVESWDGGARWADRDSGIPREGNIGRVRFVDANHGYAVGGYPIGSFHASSGFVLETVDAGASWQIVADVPDLFLLDFSVRPDGSVVAVGLNLATFSATVLIGNGTTWAPTEPGYLAIPYGVATPAPGTLVVVGINGATGSALILRSADDGATWSESTAPAGQTLYTVAFADALHGLSAGDSGNLLGTDDGGTTWSVLDSGTTLDLVDAHYDNGVVRIAGGNVDGNDGIVLASDDAGASWSSQVFDHAINGVAFDGASSGVAVGYSGRAYTTADGANWHVGTSAVSPEGLFAVAFADRARGIAVGGAGTALRTIDSGATWTPLDTASGEWLYGISMPDSQFAMAVGGSRTANTPAIVATSDGGDTWIDRASFTFPAYELEAVKCPVAGTCIAVGNCGAILRTEDGGENWTEVRTADCQTRVTLNAVDFADTQLGVAVGINIVLRTTDGGTTWTSQTPPSDQVLRGVAFADADHVFIAGGHNANRGTILASVDGGATWTSQRDDLEDVLDGVDFSDALNGTAVALGGTVYGTTDGGTTWNVVDTSSANFYGVVQFDAARSTTVGWSTGNAVVRAHDDHLLQDGFD